MQIIKVIKKRKKYRGPDKKVFADYRWNLLRVEMSEDEYFKIKTLLEIDEEKSLKRVKKLFTMEQSNHDKC